MIWGVPPSHSCSGSELAAGKLVEHFNPHVPFIIGVAAVALGAAVLTTVHAALPAADAGFVVVPAEGDLGRVEAAEPVGVGAGLGSADRASPRPGKSTSRVP